MIYSKFDSLAIANGILLFKIWRIRVNKKLEEDNKQSDLKHNQKLLKVITDFINDNNDCRFIFFGYDHNGMRLITGGAITPHAIVGLLEHAKSYILNDIMASISANDNAERMRDLISAIYQREADEAAKQ
jgi:hypothetical protein